MGANKYTVSDRVWQGILVMVRNPEVITFLTPLPRKDPGRFRWMGLEISEYRKERKEFFKKSGLKQRDIDAVIRAISWAEAKEYKSQS
jgi:hypothetical protein